MTHFDAGVLHDPLTGDTPVSFWETVHGPVTGYGNVGGKRVALAQLRSTRGREIKAALDVYDLSTGRLKSAQQFTHDLSRFEMSFNGFYVDSKHVAYVSSGRLPVRAAGVDPGFPTVGTGAYDWTGFLAPAAHPQAIDPANGQLVNWNNKPAPGFAAADDNFAYGTIHRSLLLSGGLKPGKNTVLDVVNTMNKAATQDLRAVTVWPDINTKLALAPAPTPRDEQLRQLVNTWLQQGASRLDRNGDGKIDDPGAAILDHAWAKLADAVLSPVLGSLTDQLATLMGRDNARTHRGRPTSTAGTATSTRTFVAGSRTTTATRATRRRARRASGPRSTQPATSWRRRRGRIRRPGAPTRSPSAFTSHRGSFRRRCAGRTADVPADPLVRRPPLARPESLHFNL